jgi:hypothetical protein
VTWHPNIDENLVRKDVDSSDGDAKKNDNFGSDKEQTKQVTGQLTEVESGDISSHVGASLTTGPSDHKANRCSAYNCSFTKLHGKHLCEMKCVRASRKIEKAMSLTVDCLESSARSIRQSRDLLHCLRKDDISDDKIGVF